MKMQSIWAHRQMTPHLLIMEFCCLLENNQIERIQLNMYDRNISIVYLK